jgi:hypothetical protein
MSISPLEAADALREIKASAARSREFKGYRLAAPYFFVWGAVWILGYGATGIAPRYGVAWLPLTIAGIAASAYIGWRNRKQDEPGAPRIGRAWGASFIAFALFITATYAILPPHDVNQMNAFPALVTAMSYALAGLWTNRVRLTWLGAAIAAATMGGFFFLTPWFAFWMAAVGGGGLILTGFWMRKA